MRIFAIVIVSILGLGACKKSETPASYNKTESMASDNLSLDFKPMFDTTHFEKVSIGELYLPTGEIIASDPFFIEDVKPFSKKVEKGSYPVELLFYKVGEDHHRVAFARVKFSDSPATHWELAITENISQEQIDSLEAGEFFGYGVDAGLGSFTDVESARIFTEALSLNDNYYNEVLEDEFDKSSSHPLSREGGDWNNHFPKKGSKNNVIMFSSGWGDGFYPTYWGTDSSGKIVELITDFGVVGVE